MGLLALQREQQRRRREIVVRNGSIATVCNRMELPFQRVGDDDPQHGVTSGCSTPYLPEDIWRHIHSLMPMHDAARAACLSHAFLRSWRCHPNLTLDWKTLCLKRRGRNFSCIVDSILRNHTGIDLKILKLNLHEDIRTFPYVDSWLQIAVTPGIEELNLTLHNKYNFPCSLLSDGVRNSIRYLRLDSCAFHPPVELGPLRSLTSLYLDFVCITGDELECLLSNSLALEQLDLRDCSGIISLKIPCVLHQLSSLIVMRCENLQEMEIKAPNLSRIYIDGEIKLSLGEASQIKDLSLFRTNSVCYARAELPSIMPNLERLTLYSYDEVVNTPMLPTKFLYLKHLYISMTSGVAFSPSYDYFSLVSFFNVSPSLETLFLDVSQECMEHESVFGSCSQMRQLPEHHHVCLKSLEIRGFSSAKGLIELTCCIVKNTVSLERLVLDTLFTDYSRCSGENNKNCRPLSKTVLKEAFRAVTAIRTYIEDEVPPATKLTVVEPCARCHSRDGAEGIL